MNTRNNTVLVTGGGSGIGLETARLFLEAGNTVIIIGRDEQKLRAAEAQLPGLRALRCDVTSEVDVAGLAALLEQEYPALNILVNNAGKAHAYRLSDGPGSLQHAETEMATNYFAALRMTERLLPQLQRQPAAAIVNISSVVALVPAGILPTYSASKAALHSYTQSLRHALRHTQVLVTEVLPPLVDTDFSRALPGPKMSPAAVAAAVVQAVAAGETEVHVGETASVHRLFHADPASAFAAMNGVD